MLRRMLGCGRFRRAGLGVLLALGGCSSSYKPENKPIDPAITAALEAERAQERAELEAELAEAAELERAVSIIENEAGEPPRTLVAGEVSQLFLYYCGECHSAELGELGYWDGMFGIEDLELMIEKGKIIPGDGEGSRLVQRMREGTMPPPTAENAPMSAPSVDRIIAFIDTLPEPVELPAEE